MKRIINIIGGLLIAIALFALLGIIGGLDVETMTIGKAAVCSLGGFITGVAGCAIRAAANR